MAEDAGEAMTALAGAIEAGDTLVAWHWLDHHWLDHVGDALTALARERDAAVARAEAMAPVVSAALQWEIDALSSWDGDESIAEHCAHAPLMAAILAFRTNAATAPPEGGRDG